MAELYNEGLFRKGLVRTSGLVRPDLLLTFDDIFSPYAIDRLEAALALDFNNNVYRTGNKYTTFADAFTGTSPKLTYSTAAGSNSTMVNSAGEIVWAPHNLVPYSEDFSQWNSNAATLDVTLHEAPDGTQTARKLVAPASASSSEHFLYRSNSEELGSQGKIAIFAKADEYDNLRIIELTGYRYYASFDLGSGNPPSRVSASGGANFVSASATPVGGGWFLCEIVTNRSTAGAFSVMGFPDGSAPTNAPANYTGDGTSGVYVWGAHVYRSDLGGMHPVPGAATGFEYYVPTSGSAEYLPRVGHHVYNGTTWVNEGLLIESEPRTNLVTYSEDNSQWYIGNSASLSDGTDGFTLGTTATGFTNSRFATPNSTITMADGQILTASWEIDTSQSDDITDSSFELYFGRSASNRLKQVIQISGNTITQGTPFSGGGLFQVPSSGSSTTPVQTGPTTWRISITAENISGADENVVCGFWDRSTTLSRTIAVRNPQIEAGPTPSSYMPTSGGTYTRTAQSLEVPPAQFGWPEPEYIGPELVTDFSTYADQTAFDVDWTRSANSTFSNGTLVLQNAGYGETNSSNIGYTAGTPVVVTFDVTVSSGTVEVWLGDTLSFDYQLITTTSSGTFTVARASTGTDGHIYIRSLAAGTDASVSNISVREINPLSVSIQMDGRMTYADEGITSTGMLMSWSDVANDVRLQLRLDTAVATGRIAGVHRASSPSIFQSTPAGSLSSGILVPMNVSGRFGSTFLQVALDGVSTADNTNPTALPDLSSTNLQIAQDFMGTIGTFRQFAGDIGDTGLVTATNPSTEPTLSLTFDGTGSSYYNLNWSE